jgi:hypothetical protein
MPDPAQQLARLYQAGFEIQKLERFPRAIAIIREECIVLAEPQPSGLALIGKAGWRLGETIAVLVEQQGTLLFQAKAETLDATSNRLEKLRAFERDLSELLLSAA